MKKLLALLLLASLSISSQNSIEQDIIDIEDKLIEWRHDFHQNPELSNREFKTAEKIAKHLKSLGLEVETNIAKTGVAIIMVEQNAKQALQIADTGYVLVQGENKFNDTGAALLANAEVRQAFLGG